MKQYRCEIHGADDKNLIAKFFYAESAQSAVQKCRDWLRYPGAHITASET